MLQLRITQCNWYDLNVIYPVAESLARYFPKPDEVMIAIYELILNAIEHGTLGLGYETKTELLRSGKWHEELGRRLAASQVQDKAVTVSLECNETGIVLSIADEGRGFTWQDFTGRKQSIDRPNGRGLWLAFHSAFDEISFNPEGNVVTCRMAREAKSHQLQTSPQLVQRA